MPSVHCRPVLPDAVQDFGTIPVMPLLCGRCGNVLDEMSVDVGRGWVFYRPQLVPRGAPARRSRLRLRGPRRPWVASGRDLPGEAMTYTCATRACRSTYRLTYEDLRVAVLRSVRAGRSRVLLGSDV